MVLPSSPQDGIFHRLEHDDAVQAGFLPRHTIAHGIILNSLRFFRYSSREFYAEMHWNLSPEDHAPLKSMGIDANCVLSK